jgi:hypothetical protein
VAAVALAVECHCRQSPVCVGVVVNVVNADSGLLWRMVDSHKICLAMIVLLLPLLLLPGVSGRRLSVHRFSRTPHFYLLTHLSVAQICYERVDTR